MNIIWEWITKKIKGEKPKEDIKPELTEDDILNLNLRLNRIESKVEYALYNHNITTKSVVR
jgi:hypothetical protein